MVHILLDKIRLYRHPNVTYNISYGFCASGILCPTVLAQAFMQKAIMPIEPFVIQSTNQKSKPAESRD